MRLSGKMVDMALSSRFMNRDLPLIVYTPPDYTADKRYPLLIAQDGRDYLQIGRLASTADKWISCGVISPLIMIAIPYQSPAARWQHYHPDGPMYRSYIHMLCDEMIPFAASRLSLTDLPEERTLIGDSLGGTVSFLAALRRPDLFGGVIMQSPYVDQQIVRHADAGDPPHFIYHSIGRNETAVKTTRGTTENFFKSNLELRRALLSRQTDHYIFVETGGIHTWRFWQQDVWRALMERYALRP